MTKRILEPNEFTFTPSLGRIAFAVPSFAIHRLYAIINLTSGEKLYAAGLTGLGFRSVAGSTVSLQADTVDMLSTDSLLVLYDDPATQTVNGPLTDAQLRASPVPVSSATLATDATLQQILTAIRAQRVETIWTDDTGARFIRVDIGGAIVWTDVAGLATTAPGSGARPDSDSSTVVSRSTYRATASGSGFAVNDVLDHLVVTDGDAGDLVSNFWINVTAGTKIAAPAASSITPQSPLPDGAATASAQATANTALGAPADAPASSDGGAFGLIALLKRALGNWTTLLARLPALSGGRIPVDGSGVTQPISAASLPLPTGASTLANDNQRATYFSDVGPGTLNANTTSTNAPRDAGVSPSAFTKFNALFTATLPSTCIVQGSDDGTNWFTLFRGSTATPGSGADYDTVWASIPVAYRYHRTRIISGANATSVYVKSSYSVN